MGTRDLKLIEIKTKKGKEDKDCRRREGGEGRGEERKEEGRMEGGRGGGGEEGEKESGWVV